MQAAVDLRDDLVDRARGTRLFDIRELLIEPRLVQSATLGRRNDQHQGHSRLRGPRLLAQLSQGKDRWLPVLPGLGRQQLENLDQVQPAQVRLKRREIRRAPRPLGRY